MNMNNLAQRVSSEFLCIEKHFCMHVIDPQHAWPVMHMQYGIGSEIVLTRSIIKHVSAVHTCDNSFLDIQYLLLQRHHF